MGKIKLPDGLEYSFIGNTDDVSDSWHTFGELYEFRKMYNACLFNEWAKKRVKYLDGLSKGWSYLQEEIDFYYTHKSWKHNDGKWCFGEEKKWFIVSAMLPTGLISNHYKAEDWDLFQVPEVEKALFEFDGHTGIDVLQRLKDLCTK